MAVVEWPLELGLRRSTRMREIHRAPAAGVPLMPPKASLIGQAVRVLRGGAFQGVQRSVARQRRQSRLLLRVESLDGVPSSHSASAAFAQSSLNA